MFIKLEKKERFFTGIFIKISLLFFILGVILFLIYFTFRSLEEFWIMSEGDRNYIMNKIELVEIK